MTKTLMIAVASAALISTSAAAGNLEAPVSDAMVPMIEEMAPASSSLGGSLGGNSGIVLGVLGLLVIGAVASGSGT